MRINPESLARASSRHPWRVIGVWGVLFFVMVGLASTLLGDVLNNDISFTNRPESIKAQEVIDAQFTAAQQGASTEFVIVHSETLTVDDPAYKAYVQELQSALAAEPDLVVGTPTTYYDALEASPDAAAGLVSEDQHYTLISFSIAQDDTATVEGVRDVLASTTADGFTTQLAGQSTLNADFTTIAEEDARKGESIGIMVALVVLIVVFAAIIAALVPIGMAIVAIGIALGIVALDRADRRVQPVRHEHHLDDRFGGRHRLLAVHRVAVPGGAEEGFDKLEAIGAAGATANRAVFFSGMTVVLALLGMFIIPTTIFRAPRGRRHPRDPCCDRSSMTLLPAILAKLGDRINWPRLSKRARLDSPYDVPGRLLGPASRERS